MHIICRALVVTGPVKSTQHRKAAVDRGGAVMISMSSFHTSKDSLQIWKRCRL